MNALALFVWTLDDLFGYGGLALLLVAGIAWIAFCFARDGFQTWRAKRHAWREGHAQLVGHDHFTRMDPPAKVVAKRVLLGRLTNSEIQDIELRMREARNLAVGTDPRPWQIATLNDTERLAIVDVARLLAHIRNLEDRK